MKVAVLSGKGGAGKTFVAVNLAAAGPATYIDCDVEEPNGRLFFRPEGVRAESVSTLLPEFDGEKCSGCRKCVEFCRFHALLYLRGKPMVFPEVCHSCGGCALTCPAGAIREVPREIGAVETGRRGAVTVVTGVLRPGEASGMPVIRQALGQAAGWTCIDCPPGSACGVLECVQAADCCVLVAEPTAFGFHNFRMVHELVKLLQKPCGVVVNKASAPYPPLEDYCEAHGLPIWERFAYDAALGRMLSEGQVAAEASEAYRARFAALREKIGGGQ